MRKYKHIVVALAVFLVPLVVWVGMGATPFGWQNKSDVDITTDILVGTSAATSALDSTACFQWCPSFTVTLGPGYNDTSYFARGKTATGYQDSIMKRCYIRGWTTPTRTQLISVTPLWSYAAPFNAVGGGGRPRSHFWGSTTNGQADSSTRYILAQRADFFLTGGVTTFDSTSYYYGDGRNKTYIHIPFAPYYDILMADSAAVSGKSGRTKVTVMGFNVK